MSLSEKKEALCENLKKMGKVCVAFSGGIDSMLLLDSALAALGKDNVIAVIVDSPFFAREDINRAVTYCQNKDIEHRVSSLDVLEIDELRENDVTRCYVCKTNMLARIMQVAEMEGIANILEGSNADDLSDYRPGMRAVEELGIKSPLLEAGLTKAEVRELSKQMGSEFWNLPSSPCLATRFVFGQQISEDRLHAVEAAERLLREMGFSQVRVRAHMSGDAMLARIELAPEEIDKLVEHDVRATVVSRLEDLGFSFVSVDLKGYGRGRMNVGIDAINS